jgi:hypothetical protein
MYVSFFLFADFPVALTVDCEALSFFTPGLQFQASLSPPPADLPTVGFF